MNNLTLIHYITIFSCCAPDREEVYSHLKELERNGFLKPTDDEDVWEFNMVERDIVYQVIPPSHRRKLHAQVIDDMSDCMLR